MRVTLKDGTVRSYDRPMSVYDIAFSISEELAGEAAAGLLNGRLVDLRTVIGEDCTLKIIRVTEPDGLRVLRNTATNILAEAVHRLFPEAKLALGQSIDDGFYYDFEAEPFDREDLDRIEVEMQAIISRASAIERRTVSREEAKAFMEKCDEPYKLELIDSFAPSAPIYFYDQGGFIDMCDDPHLLSTAAVKAFKLTSSSMAYWRGDSNKARLQRIYGSAFTCEEDLEKYLQHLEEMTMFDHNRLGREMKLYFTSDVIGQGLPLFTPRGTKMIMKLQRWIEDLEDNEWGFLRTKTPLMAKTDLFKISGHWDHYQGGIYTLNQADDTKDQLALRPMTCPFQYQVYMNEQHSYRDLPYRMSETATLFRDEDSGEMHGLTRIRQFTITEGHIIVAPEKVEDELERCVDLANYVMTSLGLQDDVTYRLSKWDPENREKYLGDEEYWNTAQDCLRDVMVKNNIKFKEADGEAAFYGPKIDIQAKNVYGKEDTMVTIQLDCASAEKFGMYYIDENGAKARPYIIHRTSMGCYERTLAWLIEHYAGKFPTWMCAEQVRILAISEKYHDYAVKVHRAFRKAGIDSTVDDRDESLGYKIRDARNDRLPYWVIVGEKEEAENTVSVSSRFAGNEGSRSVADFIAALREEIDNKVIREVEVTE